jgi:phage-related protein
MSDDRESQADESCKPLFWIASSRVDLRAFPEEVKCVMGFALYEAQMGGKHVDAKPLKGFGGAGVLEIAEDFSGNTYRGVYTVKFARAVYVLDAFQKKSKTGVKTPKGDINRIKRRLKAAEDHYQRWKIAKRKKEDGK